MRRAWETLVAEQKRKLRRSLMAAPPHYYMEEVNDPIGFCQVCASDDYREGHHIGVIRAESLGL